MRAMFVCVWVCGWVGGCMMILGVCVGVWVCVAAVCVMKLFEISSRPCGRPCVRVCVRLRARAGCGKRMLRWRARGGRAAARSLQTRSSTYWHLMGCTYRMQQVCICMKLCVCMRTCACAYWCMRVCLRVCACACVYGGIQTGEPARLRIQV